MLLDNAEIALDIVGMLLDVAGMLLGCCWDAARMMLDVDEIFPDVAER
jgi:hypothetical protein